MTKLKQRKRRTDSVFLCKTCKKHPIEVYQLDKEVCFECWQAETFLSFIDNTVTPTY